MCDKCKELVMCPVGEKRKAYVDFPTDSEIVDFYRNKIHVDAWVMYVDRYPDGKVDSGLYRTIYDDNGVQYGGGLDITHCPFCGEKFA